MAQKQRGGIVGLLFSWYIISATSVMAQPAEGQDRPRVPTLTVSGQAEVSVKPDEAVIRLGAVAQATQASSAQEQVNEIMTRAIDSIRDLGIPQDAITTVGLSLQPVYAEHRPRPMQDPHPQEPRIVGYRASNTIRVRLSDLSRIGDVIDAGIHAGANQLEGLSFGLRDDTGAKTAALREASKQARAKADAIADAMNLKIDGILEISEGGAGVVPRFHEMGARVMAADVGTPVQPGQIQVSGSVSVVYRISPR